MRRLITTAAFVLLAGQAVAQLPAPTFSGLTMTGEINATASTASSASLNMPTGTPPSNCVDGDMWHTLSGYYGCNAGVVTGPFSTGSQVPAAPASTNAIAYYSSANAIGGLATTPNGVLGTSAGGVPSLSTTLPAGLSIPGANVGAAVYTIATLPTPTVGQKGQLAWASDCLNGTQGAGTGTGCLYVINSNGIWTPMPATPTSGITIGGQLVLLGGSTFNQGTGAKIQLTTGSFTNGHGVVYDSNGNLIDAGGPPTIGGGSGTVTAAAQNQLAYYASAGTTATVSGITSVNSAVVVTNSSGVPSEATTLPTGLTIPTATLSNAALTGSGTYVGLTGSGKLTSAAGTTTQAGLSVLPGVAPTSPANGDIWETSAALLTRINGATQTLLSTVNTTTPLGGGGAGPTLTVTCATCATTTSGGALTATAPMSISSAGLIALGTQRAPITFIADSLTVIHNDTYDLIESWPYTNSGTVDSVTYHTAGSSSPAFTIALQINGTNVGTCNAISVSSATNASATCTTPLTIASGQKLSLVITGTTGAPSSAVVQTNIHVPAS